MLENLDANTSGTTGGQPGDKVQDGKKAGRDKPRRDEEGLRQVRFQLKVSHTAVGIGGVNRHVPGLYAEGSKEELPENVSRPRFGAVC